MFRPILSAFGHAHYWI